MDDVGHCNFFAIASESSHCCTIYRRRDSSHPLWQALTMIHDILLLYCTRFALLGVIMSGGTRRKMLGKLGPSRRVSPRWVPAATKGCGDPTRTPMLAKARSDWARLDAPHIQYLNQCGVALQRNRSRLHIAPLACGHSCIMKKVYKV